MQMHEGEHAYTKRTDAPHNRVVIRDSASPIFAPPPPVAACRRWRIFGAHTHHCDRIPGHAGSHWCVDGHEPYTWSDDE